MDPNKLLSNTLNTIPVVGHVKGLAHYISGDPEAGNEALNAATRSTFVLAAGAATEGIGAVPAGIAYDTVQSAITGKPQGYVDATKNLIENPSLSTVLDTTLTVVGDVSTGNLARGLNNMVSPKTVSGVRLATTKGKDAIMFPTKAHTDKLNKQLAKKIVDTAIIGAHRIWNNQLLSTTYKKNSSNEDETDDILDAFDYDEYKVDKHAPLSEQQKRDALQQKKYQTPKGHLPRNIRNQNVPIANKEQLNDSKTKFKRPDGRSNRDDENLWRRSAWLYVSMPRTFNYTGAVVTNMLQQGLLHMIIRHGNQVANHIPDFETIFRRLPRQIQSIIRQLQDADDEDTSRAITAMLEQALQSLDPKTFVDTEEILYELQMKLYEYLQRIILNGNNGGYLGEGCNNRRRQNVFFRATDLRGRTQVMVVCVSDQLYDNPDYFGNDKRPIRAIITCYFISWDEYLRRRVDDLY